METDIPFSRKEVNHVLLVSFIAFAVLITAVFLSYQYAKKYTSYVILPGGTDAYYGEPQKTQQNPQPQTRSNTFFADAKEEWKQQKGILFPYSFSYPSSMKLGVFPGDPHDPVTIFWGNLDSQQTIFMRVELLDTDEFRTYIPLPKRRFVEDWWKQYSYNGIASYTEITNKAGLKGHRASYADSSGNASKYHFFFEVPGRSDIMLWMSSDIIDWSVFERMIESLSWDAK